MSYADAELEAMMADLESDLVERKESAQDGRKIRRNICAFANDLPRNGRPGVLFIGVRDDGSCASLQVDDALLKRLAGIHGEGQILPLPSITVQRKVLMGCEVAVVAVEPSPEPPVRFQGRVWVRVGASLREGSAADEQRLTERRRAIDLPFDSRPAERTSLDALDTAFVRDRYLPSAIAQDVLERNARRKPGPGVRHICSGLVVTAKPGIRCGRVNRAKGIAVTEGIVASGEGVGKEVGGGRRVLWRGVGAGCVPLSG